MVTGLSEIVELADQYWHFHRASAQLSNIDRGDVEQIEHWEDLRPHAVALRIAQLDDFGTRAATLFNSELSSRERALLAAVGFSARSMASLLPYERDLALVAGPFNFATFVSVLVPGYSLVTREHGEGYLAKLRSMPSFIDGWIAGLAEGVAVGRVATARGVAAAITAWDAMLSADLVDDPLATQSPPTEISPAEVDQWRNDVLEAISEITRPAIARLRNALGDVVLPAARSDVEAGICHLPGGIDGYQSLLRAATSTELTAEAIHELGLQQLALLDDEYHRLGPDACGLDDPALIRERLRTDPSLRYGTAEEIIADAMATLARAEAEVPRWFGRIPRARCNAVAVNSGPLAFYTGPSPDGTRPGTFFYKTAEPQAWTRFQLEVSTFHEAVPGHHLQVALALEADLHPVLGELEVTSYGEGWGLYAERLADEMSLYSSPLQRMGMVTLDSLRAARLVVDTGLHAMGWSRDRAIEFLLAHTAQDRSNAEAEVDRYIAQPGQATSYMIGRLELQRIRGQAERHLGPHFSISDFHDVVLANGMTPLDELARTVDDWLQRISPPGG